MIVILIHVIMVVIALMESIPLCVIVLLGYSVTLVSYFCISVAFWVLIALIQAASFIYTNEFGS